MGFSIPTVEISNHGNFPRIRGPDPKASPRLPIHRHGMRTQFFIDAVVAALIEEIEILLTKQADIAAGRKICDWVHRRLKSKPSNL